MAPRDPATLDTDLRKVESYISDLKTELGKIPSGRAETVLGQLANLKNAPQDIIQLKTDVGKNTADIAKLKEKFKYFRYMILGLVIGLQAVKIDVQVAKLDITLWKEWKKKDFVEGMKNAAGFTKVMFRKQAREMRKQLKAQAKQQEEDAKLAKKELDAKLKGIPEKVRKLEEAVETDDLRRKLDRVYYQKSRAGGIHKRINHAQATADKANRDIDALRTALRKAGREASPGPATGKARKNVSELRASVSELTKALAGI